MQSTKSIRLVETNQSKEIIDLKQNLKNNEIKSPIIEYQQQS
jgi:hypothetical protein